MAFYAIRNYFEAEQAFELKKSSDKLLVIYNHQKPNVVQWAIDTNYYKSLGIVPFQNDNESAKVLLLDENNIVQYTDFDFRAQGEHIKPLEQAVKKLLNIADDFYELKNKKETPWQIGDYVGDLELEKGKTIKEYKEKPILLTFYPAAFSGSTDFLKEKKAENPFSHFQEPMLCTYQIRDIKPIKSIKNVTLSENFVISSSTTSLLRDWQGFLNVRDITFLNDPDYRISQTLQSYDYENGYNKRCSFIIQNGIIQYIDWSFDMGDGAVLQGEMLKLIGEKK